MFQSCAVNMNLHCNALFEAREAISSSWAVGLDDIVGHGWAWEKSLLR